MVHLAPHGPFPPYSWICSRHLPKTTPLPPVFLGPTRSANVWAGPALLHHSDPVWPWWHICRRRHFNRGRIRSFWGGQKPWPNKNKCLRFGEIAHRLLSLSDCHMFEASAAVPDCRLISSGPRPSQISRANGERASGVAMKMKAWIQTRKHMNKMKKKHDNNSTSLHSIRWIELDKLYRKPQSL